MEMLIVTLISSVALLYIIWSFKRKFKGNSGCGCGCSCDSKNSECEISEVKRSEKKEEIHDGKKRDQEIDNSVG
ncbi:MAG: hypothetical protein B6240_12020 [Desulfobacteraceae bacterium 4572_87]|nr:MAG: hypothetical protein B6240_12020 [Desulfobacteraceae bacterium 4572_87]